jgi:hypothetical protein
MKTEMNMTQTYLTDMMSSLTKSGTKKVILHCLATVDVTNAEIRSVARSLGVKVRIRYNADGDTVVYRVA